MESVLEATVFMWKVCLRLPYLCGKCAGGLEATIFMWKVCLRLPYLCGKCA